MKISVTLPNFNHGVFLAQAIEGFLAQTYKDWELCLVDDGSSDDSWEIVERYRSRDRRLIAERFPQNRGAHVALNRCFELASGELLYASSADDYVSNPQFFEYAIAALERFPQAAGIFGRAAVVDGGSDKELWQMGSYRPEKAPQKASSFPIQFVRPRDAMAAFLTSRIFIPGIAAIWRRACIAEVGGYDKDLGPQSDYFVNHALAAFHGVVFIDALVSVTRRFESSYSGSVDDDEFFRRHALVEKKLRELDLPHQTDRRLFENWRGAVIGGRTAEGFQRQLLRAVRDVCGLLPASELPSLTPEFVVFMTRLQEDCSRLENDLDSRVTRAQQIFADIAGPIEPVPSIPKTPLEQKRRSWWRRLWS